MSGNSSRPRPRAGSLDSTRAPWLSSLLRLGGAAALGTAWVVACAGGEGVELPAGRGVTGEDPAVPCETGATRACGVTLAKNGDVLSCYRGTATCDAGTWGSCRDGMVVSQEVPDLPQRLELSPQALSDATSCASNPCDPNCRIFVEEPDAAIATEQGDPIFVWTSGDLDDFPGGLVDKGLVTPCTSGYDCQFNHECVEPVTHPSCAHSKCEPGAALAADCEDAYGEANAPSCVALICDAQPECCAATYAGSCDHDPCDVGTPLKSTCEPCMATLCATEPACCGIAAASSTDPITVEVEDYTGGDLSENGNDWSLYTSASASGGEGMKATPDDGRNRDTDYLTKSPRLDFDVNFASTGRWHVWVRGRADGSSAGSSDSCHIGLDGGGVSTSDRITGFVSSGFTWSKATGDSTDAYIDIATAGDHVVNLWMREDGFVGDRILLTKDSAYVPTGTGPGAEAPTGALLSVEAEAYETSSRLSQGGNSWVQRDDATAASGQYMLADPDSGNTRNGSSDYLADSPRLDFRLAFPSSGRWYVFVRGKGKDGSSDSVHVGLAGAHTASADRIGSFTTSWSWLTVTMDGSSLPYLDVPSAGTHEVNVWMREDGFAFDKLILTQDAAYIPAGTGPSGGIGGAIGVWTDECVALYESTCGADCTAGGWTADCVAAVGTVCDATCGERPVATCSHSVCEAGDPLDARCHPCAEDICKVDPLCCIDGWDADCVSRIPSVCGTTCPVDMHTAPPESGVCEPRMPGSIDTSCDGIDLAIGVPCEGILPICNHGTETAPAGIRVIHLPGNSGQYPKTAPNESHPQLEECFTSAEIQPGHCTNIDDCPGLTGNREVMVNPESTGLDECSRLDNWSLFAAAADSECKVPVCSQSDTTAQFVDSSLYVIMDRSGSMKDDSKWTKSVAALKAFFQSEDAAGIRASLEFFSISSGGTRGDGCGPDCDPAKCANPMVAPAFLTSDTGAADTQETALTTALNSMTADGGTPMYAALAGTVDLAIEERASTPNDFHAVILVTDGEPNGCEENTNEIAKLALNGWLNYGIRTYTVGLEGSNIDMLDTVAQAGGTRAAFVVRSGANVENDLLAALLAITRSTARCEFSIQNGLYINPYEAVLTYTPGSGAAVDLPLLDSPDDCGTGWYYDDPSDPTSAALCPETCEEVQGDVSAQVTMEVGCAEPYEGTEFTESYTATCPTGGQQWGFFTWDADLERGAEILFEARTAQAADELASAAWVEVGTATDALQACGMGGPAPTCPVNLYDVLGGGSRAKAPHLELRATLSPNSSRTSKAVLNSWEITYTCVDDE